MDKSAWTGGIQMLLEAYRSPNALAYTEMTNVLFYEGKSAMLMASLSDLKEIQEYVDSPLGFLSYPVDSESRQYTNGISFRNVYSVSKDAAYKDVAIRLIRELMNGEADAYFANSDGQGASTRMEQLEKEQGVDLSGVLALEIDSRKYSGEEVPDSFVFKGHDVVDKMINEAIDSSKTAEQIYEELESSLTEVFERNRTATEESVN